MKIYLISITYWLILINSYSQSDYKFSNDNLSSVNTLYNIAVDFSDINPDSAQVLLYKCKVLYAQESDSFGIVQCLIELSDLEKFKENYSQSYDYLWEGLSMAAHSNNRGQLYEIHKRLGMLYSIFEKDDEALSHKILTLNLCRQLINDEKLNKQRLLSCYFSIAIYYRKILNYDLALTYFDSCRLELGNVENGELKNGFVMAELGYMKLVQDDYESAEKLIIEAIELLLEEHAQYLVFAYAYLAELKEKQGLINDAIEIYLKCLKTIDRVNAHIDLRPDIFNRLSKLYHTQNNAAKAYYYLRESKNINDSLFNVKSIGNRLFNMRNKYEEDLEQKNEQLKAHELLLIKKSQSNLKLRILISLLLLFMAVIGFLLLNYFQKKKHKNEKREIALKNQHEKEKAQEILNVKNKELTSYTLQLIDKDRIVNELYEFIRNEIKDSTSIDHLKRSISGNDTKMWEEFNLRFVAVNADFYANLRAKFPNLTPNERKYCALIKLRFSSKDIAQLLRVSLETVHITRHRLRKKMNLRQGTNLSNYVADI
ncbi:hypothetical protein OAO55_03240 [Bacteroidales bacterium]|nr:hypothetical protein [Bacteroidales bacterium]